MICETFDIKNENSQEYARLNTYLISHSDSIKTETRPLIILCPGGGYWFTSEREGEMLALQFVAAGFHAAILWYSVKLATFPTALLELAKSVELVRKHAKEWYVDPDKIVVEGVQTLKDGQKITPITQAEKEAKFQKALQDQRDGNIQTAFK